MALEVAGKLQIGDDPDEDSRWMTRSARHRSGPQPVRRHQGSQALDLRSRGGTGDAAIARRDAATASMSIARSGTFSRV